MKNVEQRFNEMVIELFKNNQASYACLNNIPAYFIGSEDLEGKKAFFVRPEILRIYSTNVNTIFQNSFPINQNIFDAEFCKKMKIGFSKSLIIKLINKITDSNDPELELFLIENLTKTYDKVSLLLEGDKLSDKALNLVLKSNVYIDKNVKKFYRRDCLDKGFLKFLFNRLNKSSEDSSEELKIFLAHYLKDFQKTDYLASLLFFVENKYPERLNDYKKFLGVKDDEKPLISACTDLISIKLNKEELYKSIDNNSGIIDKEKYWQYWQTLGYVEKFLTKERKLLGINYCLLSGYNNTNDSFIVIVETNDKFKLNPELFGEVVIKLFNTFFSFKGLKLSNKEINEGKAIVNYGLLTASLDVEKSDKKKLKI